MLSKSKVQCYSVKGVIEEISTDEMLIEHRLFFDAFTDQDPASTRLTVASWLSSKIVPVKVAGMSKTIWLLATSACIDTEDLAEVVREARQKGWELHPEYQVIQVGAPLLLSISRGNVSGRRLRLHASVIKTPQQAELFNQFQSIIDWACEQGAADVDFRCAHRDERSQVAFSINGKWVYPERYRMSSDTMRQIIGLAYQYGEGASESALDLSKEQQLRIFLHLPRSRRNVMLRWASMAGDDVLSVTTRLISLDRKSDGVTLESLGYLPSQLAILRRVLNSDGGAVIFSGVVNSGKSTTIATILGLVPSHRKIITIEDPVEFAVPGAVTNTVARPLTGEPSPILAAKLKTLKRTGFNDLLLGEIRDRETGAAAQDVFESGQKLWTTVHTGRAWMIPDRLAGQSIGIPREVLATPGNLRLLVNQSLLPKNCPHCRRPFSSLLEGSDGAHWKAYGERLRRLYDIDLGQVYVRNPSGCQHCRRPELPELAGFSGRTSVSEMIEPDEEFCRLVATGDNVGILHYLDRLRGGRRFDDSDMTGKSSMDCAIYKMTRGEIDPREIEPRFVAFETVELTRQAHQAMTGAS